LGRELNVLIPGVFFLGYVAIGVLLP
jgi:hypothetical protein